MSQLTRHRVLVVEDEKHLAIGIQFNLQAEGYEVVTVGDAPAALDLIHEQHQPFDVLILDIMMPGMSGYALCERLRHLGYHMPILMLSARTLAEDRTRGFDAGANQYLTKPFELDELISRVRNLVSHPQPTPIPKSKTSSSNTTQQECSFGNAQDQLQYI